MGRRVYTYIGIILVILLSVMICVYMMRKKEDDTTTYISKDEIYSKDMGTQDVFLRTLILNEEDYHLYKDKYGFDFDIKKIDFSKNVIFLSSKYEVKEFSYIQKNRKLSRSNKNILDVIFYKKDTKEFHFYKMPANITTWEAIGYNKEDMFEE